MEPDKPASRRVLVVDDSLEMVNSLARLLRQMGHDVELAVSGYAALDAARRFQPQVVLLDINLPDTDGWTVARRLRDRFEGGAVRVIAITGRAQPGDHMRSIEAGCEYHLLKPLDPQQLERILA